MVQPIPTQSRILPQLRFSFPIAVAVLSITALTIATAALLRESSERERALTTVAARLTGQVAVRTAALQSALAQIAREARFLSEIEQITEAVRTASPNQHARDYAFRMQQVQHVFTAFAAANPHVLQARLIGIENNGPELIRVNRIDDVVSVTAADRLQNKSNLDYFQATLKLQRGSVHLDDVDLHREHGTILEPHIPSVRVATPVFSEAGAVFGIVVINVDVRVMLGSLRDNMPTNFQVYLTNSAGDFLAHPDATREFGFLFGQPHRLQREWSPLPQPLADAPDLHSYRTAHDTLHTMSRQVALDGNDAARFLTVTLAASDAVVRESVATARKALLTTAAVSLLVLGALSWLYWFSQRHRRVAFVNQARLARMVDSSNDAIIGTTLDGIITDWNPAATRIFGYTAQHSIGQSAFALLVPEDRKGEVTDLLQRVARGEAVPHFYTQRRKADGAILDVEVTFAPLHDTDGAVVGAATTVRDVTQLKAAEAALKTAQERLTIATNVNGIGVWEWQVGSRVLTFDDTLYALYGRRREDFPQAYAVWRASLHPDDVERSERTFAAVLTGEIPLDSSFRIVTPAGEIRHIRTKATVIRDAAGRPIRVLGTNFDCTIEKDRERQLDALNATLEQQVAARIAEMKTLTVLQRAILANAVNTVIATDLTGTITLFNPAAEKLLGYRSEEMVGKLSPAAFHESTEIAARATELNSELGLGLVPGFDVFTAIAHLGTTDKNEWTYIRKDGTRFPVYLSISVLRSDDGSVFGYLGIAVDLTEQRKHEHALQESERFLQAVTDNIPATIGYWDADLRLRFANTLFQTVAGKSREELLGIGMEELMGVERFRPTKPHAEAALRGERQLFERVLHRPDGRPVYKLVTFVPDIGSQGVKGFYAMSSDFTKLRQTQLQLEGLNTALQARTREAESATLAKSQLLANMSHEIRSPMNAILGMQQLLLGTELTVRQRDYADKAQSATKSLLHLLNDILDFSKLDAGKIELEQAPFNVDTLLRDLSVLLSASTGAKEVEVLFHIDPQLPSRLSGDVFRLRQILLNLTGNALKFTAQGEVMITVQVIDRSEAHTQVEIAVRDTGIGIAPEKLGSIFEGFNQAEASTARRFGGSGLGLAISQRLVTAMGGTLQVESELGVGSRFWFRLSFANVDLTETMVLTHLSRPQLPAELLRVLIVDDNAHAREVLLAMVQSLGLQANAVASGHEALALMRNQPRNRSLEAPYHFVLLDQKMPDMDGLQVARAIRALDLSGNPPLILMVTAYSSAAIEKELHSNPNPIDGLLLKPVTASTLFDAMINAAAPALTRGARNRSKSGLNRLAGLRLLVVDDNEMNQQVARELLTNEGAQVSIAGGGASGVTQALNAQPPFDAVLMDVQMPDVDGYEATRQIRQHTEKLPILAMTANAMASDKAACLAAGMNDHIAKPIDIDVVVATVLKHCKILGTRTLAPTTLMTPPQPSAEIELDLALRRLANNKSLYAKLARRFLQESPAMAAELRQSLREGAYAIAAAQLHTLRGLAATVGMQAVADLAARLESQIKLPGHVIDMSTDLRALDEHLASGCAALATMMATQEFALAPPTPQAKLDKPAAQAKLDELERLLTAANMNAITVFEELRSQHGAGLDGVALGQDIESLANAVDRLDFARARQDCRALRARLA